MRIALVADLHGNWPAVQALDSDLKQTKPDRILFLGDAVGKGPRSDATLDWARENCDLMLGGNWDYGIGKQIFAADDFYWNQLGEERLAFLRSLPLETELMMSGRRIRLFHGRPIMEDLVHGQSDRELIYPFFADAQGGRYDVVGYADAHRQALRTLSPGVFFNCGSVGNAMGETYCCYAVLEGTESETPAPFEVRFRMVEYDREQAVRDALAAPELPRGECFIREVQTGIYSR